MTETETDVLVVGGGAAGIAAATTAARNGARTILVNAGPILGGELNYGAPVDGCLTARGEWAVGGFARDFFAACEKYDGYIGPVCDYRALNLVCIDPEAAKLAAIDLVSRADVQVLMYTFTDQAVVDDDGRIQGVVVRNKRGRTFIRAKTVIDATDDGDIAVAMGCEMMVSDAANGSAQSESLLFRMSGVDTGRLLDFVKSAPENFGAMEYPGFAEDAAAAIAGLVKQGQPKVLLTSDGPLLRDAVADGRMYPTSWVAVSPTSTARREVSIHTTVVPDVDATEIAREGVAFDSLHEQISMCADFLQRSLPGFEEAGLSAIDPFVGIRETRQVVGDYVLTGADVLSGKKSEDGVAKGCHELDVHDTAGHRRENVKDGGSYDIPFGCLVARDARNLLVAGRSLSADREAHSTARAMGSCMAMGQAAGTAAAMLSEPGSVSDLRGINLAGLRTLLKEQGAVLDGIS
ncbi:FAD-dependent oxidoreductase [Psychromarinibacter sp. C21-152]|uniref:FAD-dependent oxidoreductase n=1 Tax=Psychromarinibacter sediminicola TaxID=3033385 RepID=A0AAE3T8X8_9RHOB|nr:FAD-dependent oxidoreductase [Psychromarinibacter sediminicola]MDF0601238.1 FAD-dependent oxidoreductase [Psychromarinibacter sediminicola]